MGACECVCSLSTSVQSLHPHRVTRIGGNGCPGLSTADDTDDRPSCPKEGRQGFAYYRIIIRSSDPDGGYEERVGVVYQPPNTAKSGQRRVYIWYG